MSSIGKLIQHPGLPPIRRLPSNLFPANSPAPSKKQISKIIKLKDHNGTQKKG